MEKSKIGLPLLVPANQDPAKAIHPTMRAFHHPSSGSDPHLAFECPRFFAARSDVSGKAKLLERVPHFGVVIALVQTHPLRPFLGGPRTHDDHAVHGGFDQFHVGPIGPGHHQAQGYSVAFGQQTAFDATFGPVRGIGAGVFPPPGALWSSPHPCSASSSQPPSAHQTVPPPLAITSRRLPLPPIPGTDHAPWNGDISPWHLKLPTDSPYARRRRWHRHTADPTPGDARHQSDGYFRVSARWAGGPTRVHLKPGSWPLLRSPPPVDASVSSLLLSSCSSDYHSRVIRIASKARSVLN